MPDTTAPPTLTNRLGTLSSKIFAARSAGEFNDLMEEFRVEHRDQVLTEGAEHLEHIADETEARVAAHYGVASGIGPGSVDMVREAARSLRSLATRASGGRPCGCSARFTRHADGCPTLTAQEG